MKIYKERTPTDNLLILYNPYYEKRVVEKHIRNGQLKHFLHVRLRHALEDVQKIRNQATHRQKTPLNVCRRYRKKMLGIGENGFLCDLVKYGKMISQS